MALKLNDSDNNEWTTEPPEDGEEIKVIENIVLSQKETGSTQIHSGPNKVENFAKIEFPNLDSGKKKGFPTLGKRCRLLIQGGQQRGKTLIGRGRRISKRFGSSLSGTRSNRYLVGNESIASKGTCIKHSIQCRDRARRSRLAEDALFYEETFEASHLHGHVKEQSHKSLLQLLHKKPKSKGSTKRPSQSPVLKNCICLKYLNRHKKLSSEEEAEKNSKSLDRKQNELGAIPKTNSTTASRATPDVDNQRLSSTELNHLNNVSPCLRPSSVDMGMLLSLSLTDPIVTAFNNNGMPERKQTEPNLHITLDARNQFHEIQTKDFPITNIPQLHATGHHVNTPTTHTQIDFTNFLIPGQRDIIQCPFYWGKIDRYQAEALLADKPEGSFLLRDSAQDDFVFSVSFRRYSRSLHARIEEEDHTFSFDSHDPGVHASKSVRGLLEHYKDPLSCMFFEPMLLSPVVRKTCFSLQALARASICDKTTFGGVSQLPLPKALKQFLREYNYKHKLRIRYIDTINGLPVTRY